MTWNRRITIAFVAGLLAALCCCGCGRESTTSPALDDGAAVIWPKPFVVTDADGLSLVEASDSLLIFDMLGNPPQFSAGQIIVGSEGEGYLRKYVSSRALGRRLFVTTAPAYLTDIVMHGGIDTVMQVRFGSSSEGGFLAGSGARGDRVLLAPGVSLAGGGIDLSGVVLYSGAVEGVLVRVTIPQGRVEFSPVLRFTSRIRGHRVAELGAEANGFLSLSLQGDLQCNSAVDFDHEVPIASLTRQFVQYIDEVPVVETITLTLVAGFKMKQGAAGTSTVEVSGAGAVELGAEYRNPTWANVDESDFRWNAHQFSYGSASEGELEMYVSPRLKVQLYDVPCCRLDRTYRLHLVEKDVGFPVFDWTLLGVQEADIEFEPGCTDRRVPRFDPDLIADPEILARGPFRTDEYVFINEWGGEGRGDGQFGYPKGIALDDAGYVYVVDSWNNRVQKFTSAGQFVLRWGVGGSGPGQFDAPEGIALDESGNVYVVDGGNNRVQKFGPDTTFVTSWGSEGSGDGELRAPLGIAISGADLYVTDNLNNRVQRFSLDGAFRGSWGVAGAGEGQFDGPMGIAVGGVDGQQVFVTDCGNSRVQAFDSEGRFLSSWGSLGAGDDQFNCPVGATRASDGLWITDIGNDRVVKCDPVGSFIVKLGSTGTGEGEFDHPEGMAVDTGGNLYVVDGRNRRIQWFAPRSR